MQIKPLFDRVLVEPKKQKQTTKSGITFTLKEEGNYIVGKVIQVGSGNMGDAQVEMQVKVGDEVIFEDYSAIKIRTDETTSYIIKQCDILAKVGEEECQN